jgi:hypothetical protein
MYQGTILTRIAAVVFVRVVSIPWIIRAVAWGREGELDGVFPSSSRRGKMQGMAEQRLSLGILLTRILLLSILVPATLLCWFAFAVTLIDERAGASPAGLPLPLFDRFLRGLPEAIFGVVLALFSVCVLIWPRQSSVKPPALTPDAPAE